MTAPISGNAAQSYGGRVDGIDDGCPGCRSSHSTIVNNSAIQGGGGIHPSDNTKTNVTIRNSIIWWNDDGGKPDWSSWPRRTRPPASPAWATTWSASCWARGTAPPRPGTRSAGQTRRLGRAGAGESHGDRHAAGWRTARPWIPASRMAGGAARRRWASGAAWAVRRAAVRRSRVRDADLVAPPPPSGSPARRADPESGRLAMQALGQRRPWRGLLIQVEWRRAHGH